jgi:heptosyltransferase-2
MCGMVDEPQRIVAFVPNWIGDAVMFTPALRSVRARFPSAKLVLVGRAGPLAALTPNPWSAEMIVDHGGILETAGAVRRGNFDLAILGPNSFRAALVAWLGGAKRRLGYNRDGRGVLLTDKLAPPRDRAGKYAVTPALDYYLQLGAALGGDVSDKRMELDVAPADDAKARELLAIAGVVPGRPVVFLNPGAAYGSSKMYPPERFAAVADALTERHGAQIIVNAGPKEQAIAAAVAAAMQRPPMLNLAGVTNSIGLVKALVRASRLMITNDTGPRHFAVALGVGVVTIFGATDPDWTTLDYPRERIVRVKVPCGPCQRKACPLPAGRDRHQCMLKIAPEMVIAVAEELLGGAP